MPIYEFKCLQCNEYMEILVLGNSSETMEMKCSKCGSVELERIISATNFTTSSGSSTGQSTALSQSRTCSGGSCTTWNLPGQDR